MKPRTLVTVGELAARLDCDDLLVVDCRKDLGDADSGRRAHAQAHIGRAIHADLDCDLSDLSKHGLGRHPLPDDHAFSATLSQWGWQPGVSVIAYDDAGGALAAARLWWMLRLAGVPDVAVLDGGIAAWREAGLPLGTAARPRTPSAVDVQFDTRELVGYDELAAGLADRTLCLVDARARPRFRGDVEPLDRVAGHVPGARNRPFGDNLGSDGRFADAGAMRQEFLALIGAHAPRHVVHMCGSGVTACHNLLAMEHAGLAGSRLFAPSWSGWSSEAGRPVATGDA